MQKIKKVHIEFLRIMACLSVLFNHTDAAVISITADGLSKSRIITLIIYFVCKTAVPLFLMIAGANLCGKTDSKAKWYHRIEFILVTILIISALYHLYYNHAFYWQEYIRNLLTGESPLIMWYLYLYLGILLLLPILQRIQLPKKFYLFLLFLYCIGPGLVPFLDYYFGVKLISEYILMLQTKPFLLTFLFGHCLENCMHKKDYSGKGLVIAGIVAVLSLSFSVGCAIYQMNITGNTFDTTMYGRVFYTPTLLLATSIFYIVKYIWMYHEFVRVDRIILQVGSCTFGIYLLGDFLRDFFVGISDYLKSRMPEILSVLIYDLILFAIGYLIVVFYKCMVTQIKKVKNYQMQE